MKVEIRHPTSDIDEIARLVDEGAGMRASPHVGNLDQRTNPHYLALLGIGVRCEIMDTLNVDDEHGRPTLKVADGSEEILVAHPSKDSKHPTVLVQGSEGLQIAMSRRERERTLPSGVVLASGKTLEQVHIRPLLASGAWVETCSTIANNVGAEGAFSQGEIAEAVLTASGGLLRVAKNGQVSPNPSRRLHATPAAIAEHGIYGCGNDQNSGFILSLAEQNAIELIEAILASRDQTHHIGGSDMTVYSKGAGYMDSPTAIALKAIAELGIKAPAKFRYVVLNKNGGIAGLSELSAKIGKVLGIDNYSQHDLAGQNLSDIVRKG